MEAQDLFKVITSQPREVIVDKWKTQVKTKDEADISVSWIGHMIATPTQFYTNFFPRDEYCVQYVVKGKGNYFANNKLYQLKKGSLWLLPKEQYHYYAADKNDPYEYFWIHLDGSGAINFLDKIGLSEDNPVLNNVLSPNIETCFLNLIDVAKQNEPNEHLLLSALNALLYELEAVFEQTNVKQPHRNNNSAIDNAIAYIKENYTEDIRLEDLAKKAMLSELYFIKKFKAKTGLTPVRFLIQYRISQSCSLLYTPMPLDEIAVACGFKNLTNYLRHFKSFLGITPTQYRKKISTPPPKC